MSLAFPRLVILSSKKVDHARHICRPLVGVLGSKYPYAAVATGIEGSEFVIAERSGRARDQELIATATANVRRQTWSWTVAEKAGILWWKRPSLLRGMGDSTALLPTDGGGIDDLPTELLFIPEAMQQASETLGSTTLFAVVPKRGWLLVCRGQAGNPFAAQGLHDAASGIASRGGRSAIDGSVVLIWESGRLTGVDGRDPDGSFYISMQGEDENNWWPTA